MHEDSIVVDCRGVCRVRSQLITGSMRFTKFASFYGMYNFFFFFFFKSVVTAEILTNIREIDLSGLFDNVTLSADTVQRNFTVIV